MSERHLKKWLEKIYHSLWVEKSCRRVVGSGNSSRVDDSKSSRWLVDSSTWQNLFKLSIWIVSRVLLVDSSMKITSQNRVDELTRSSERVDDLSTRRLDDLTDFSPTVYINGVTSLTRRLKYENYVSKSSRGVVDSGNSIRVDDSKSSRRVNKIESTSRWLNDSSTRKIWVELSI